MSHARPSDPDPHLSPDLDAGGSPTGPQTPDSASTSLGSDSARTGQSPAPRSGGGAPVVAMVVIAIVVLLLVIGMIAYALDAF